MSRCIVVGDDVKLCVDMPTDIEDECKTQWVNTRAPIVKVGDGRFLVHFNTDLNADGKIECVDAKRVRQAARAFGFSTPRHGGVARDDWSTAKQVGPFLVAYLLR